jgi:hypothetical protein
MHYHPKRYQQFPHLTEVYFLLLISVRSRNPSSVTTSSLRQPNSARLVKASEHNNTTG